MKNFLVPVGVANFTTVLRDALVISKVGSLIFNTTTDQYEYWDGAAWLPIVDYDSIGTTPLGSVDLHSDVDTTTGTPTTGDSMVWDGTNWVPSSVAGGAGSNSYVFSYDTTTQTIASANTWQKVTFSNNGELDNWAHTPGSTDFVCPSDGLYGATIELLVEKSSGGSPATGVRALFNGVEIPGSHNGMDITSNNTAFSLSRTLIFNATATQIFTVEFASAITNVSIVPAPQAAAPTTAVSAALTLRRLT